MILPANGGSSPRNDSHFFGKPVAEDNWTTGWTIARFFEVRGNKFLFLLKKRDNGADDKNVHIQAVNSKGENWHIASHDWTEGWTSAEFFTINDKTYLFILKEEGFAKDGNNAKVHNVNSDGTIGSEIYGRKWTQGWTNCRVFERGSQKFLFLLKTHGTGSDGNNVHIQKINSDGTISDNTLFAYNWTEGWTTTEFYNTPKGVFLFLLKETGAGSDGYNVHIHKVNNDGSVGARRHSYKWSEGWSHARFMSADDLNYLLLYKNDNGAGSPGIVHIHHIKDDGGVASRVVWFTEPRGDTNGTGSLAFDPMNGPRRWLDTYILLEPFTFNENGRTFLFRYNGEDGRNDTLPIRPMHDVGPMVCHVTQRSAFIWVGMVGGEPWKRPLHYSLRYKTFNGRWMSSRINYRFTPAAGSVPDQDYYTAGIFRLAVRPGLKYEYELTYGKERVASGHFFTPDASVNCTSFKAVFASCMDLDSSYTQSAWTHVDTLKPKLLMLCGDNAYSNTTARSMIWAEHLQQRGVMTFASLISRTAVMATWDDHDFGPNNSLGGTMTKGIRDESKRAFYEVFPRSLSETLPDGGIQYTFSYGDVQFYVLDLRYYRKGDNQAMIGGAQYQWLMSNFATAKAAINVIISSSTINEGGEDWETEHPNAWQKLKGLLRDYPNTLIVSGDVHNCKLVEHNVGSSVIITEVISSGIAQDPGGSKIPGYASIDFDTTGTPSASITLFNKSGTVLQMKLISFP